jgi:hypothetical protein
MRRHHMRRVALALKCRPADVDRQVFLRLREMGLLRVFLGIESGSSAGLASIGRRQTVEQEHRALSLCEDLEISTQYTIIMFHPEATLASMREDLAFVRQHAGHPLSFCRAEIYSGTPLERRMIAEGRACGNYLARTYEYTSPLTALAWTVGRDLLRDRCWSQQHLLGRIIRLDHQTTVLHHFYEGRAVDALASEFAEFELAANLDTVALIEEMFDACEANPSLDSAELRRRLSELGEREQSRRAAFDARACALREAMSAHAEGIIDLARSQLGSGGGLLERLPRHAAAVVLAMSLMNCDGSGSEKGRDGGPDGKTANDTRVFLDQGGMYEAPPPPMDAPGKDQPDASADSRDGGGKESGISPDTRTPDGRAFVDQGGMYEAPPPPMDAPRLDTRSDSASIDSRADTEAGGEAGGDTGGSDAKSSETRDALPYTRVFINQDGMYEAPPPPMDAPANKG